jgi:Glucokinase
MFCAMLSMVAGNAVLTFGARRGLYIAGRIVPRIADYLARPQFRAGAQPDSGSPDFFRDPESTIQNAADENPREDDRGRGNAEIVDAACAWRPRHYFVGLLKAGQIDQCLLRFSYLAPDIVEAIVEGRQPRPLTIRLLFQGIPLSWSNQRATFGFIH